MNSLLYKLKDYVNRYSYVPLPDGRKCYPESDYKALNYLIQGTEAVLMKLTWVRIAQAFKEEGIEFKQLLCYHDEVSYEISPQDTKKATEIIKRCFSEAPLELGVANMEAGSVKIGKNYYEVH